METVYSVGLDIAKNVFQVFLADGSGKEIQNKKLSRKAMLNFFANLQPSLIGIEACGSAHYFARTLTGYGHDVRLIQPIRVKAFLGNRDKTDAADARAICEALLHPGTRFVRVKSVAEQDLAHVSSRRDRLMKNRTQLINETRAFLAERGIIIAQGVSKFVQAMPEIIAGRWDEFSGEFQMVLTGNFSEYQRMCEEIEQLDKHIERTVAAMDEGRRLMAANGFGPLLSAALLANVGDGKQFKNGRQMSSFFGLTPREHSSGGKRRLLGITKRGDTRVRSLFVMAANAVIVGLDRRRKGADGLPDRLTSLESWVWRLRQRSGVFKAKVALANKLARIAWVILAKGATFDPNRACRAGAGF